MKKVLLVLSLIFALIPITSLHANEYENSQNSTIQGLIEICSYDENMNLLDCQSEPIFEVDIDPFMTTNYRTYTFTGEINPGYTDRCKLYYRVKETIYDVSRAASSTCTTKEYVSGYEKFEILNQDIVNYVTYEDSADYEIGNSCDGNAMRAAVTGRVVYLPYESGTTAFVKFSIKLY